MRAFFRSSCSTYAKFTSQLRSSSRMVQVLPPHMNCPLPLTTSAEVRHRRATFNQAQQKSI